MHDVLLGLRDELRDAWRFRWTAIAVAWGISVVGWLVVFAMPTYYEANARVYVDTRTPLRPLLEGVAVDQDVESQLIMVRQALLGEPHLLRVAQSAGLLPENSPPRERQPVLAGVADRLSIELEPAAVRDPRLPNTFYKITYRDTSRENAIKVVDRLLNDFVTDTLGTKRESAETAESFLVGQLNQYRDRLMAAENALAEFKSKNIGMVPGEEGGFFQRLDHEEANVQRVEAALRVALSRKTELGRQLHGEVPLVASQSGGASRRGDVSTPTDTTSRIQDAQSRLDELLLLYTDRHPDVIATRQALEELKVRQQSEIEAVRRGDFGATAVAGASLNPVFQNIQIQLHEADVQIAALRGELSDYRENVAKLRHALNTAPQVEAEYKRLTRDYEVTQTQYNALLQRLEQARVSEEAQQTGIVAFQIVDPPTAPFSPVFPTKPMLLAAVMCVALGLAAGVAWLLSKLRPVFLDTRSLAVATGVRVIGVVSHANLDRLGNSVRWDWVRCAVAAASLVGATIAVMLVHEPGSRLVQSLTG
jgi:polysaccharide chain length determinant protein (PEP-CTERM system associated)